MVRISGTKLMVKGSPRTVRLETTAGGKFHSQKGYGDTFSAVVIV